VELADLSVGLAQSSAQHGAAVSPLPQAHKGVAVAAVLPVMPAKD